MGPARANCLRDLRPLMIASAPNLARMASVARSAAARLVAFGSRRSPLRSAWSSGARSEMPTPMRRKGR